MSSLSSFLQERLRTEHAAHISSEETAPWWETGRSVEVDEATYYQYLDLLPPRFMSGHLFAFGEGAGNFVLFWSERKRFFAHQLSVTDTETFCSLAGVELHL